MNNLPQTKIKTITPLIKSLLNSINVKKKCLNIKNITLPNINKISKEKETECTDDIYKCRCPRNGGTCICMPF